MGLGLGLVRPEVTWGSSGKSSSASGSGDGGGHGGSDGGGGGGSDGSGGGGGGGGDTAGPERAACAHRGGRSKPGPSLSAKVTD